MNGNMHASRGYDNQPPPPYGFVAPPSAPPPSSMQTIGGVAPSSPYVPPYQNEACPTLVTTVVPVGRHATHMICPSCRLEINTKTKTEPGLVAYLSGFAIALLGCWFGCCLIPCCIDECMDVHHKCPNCDTYLGRCRR